MTEVIIHNDFFEQCIFLFPTKRTQGSLMNFFGSIF